MSMNDTVANHNGLYLDKSPMESITAKKKKILKWNKKQTKQKNKVNNQNLIHQTQNNKKIKPRSPKWSGVLLAEGDWTQEQQHSRQPQTQTQPRNRCNQLEDTITWLPFLGWLDCVGWCLGRTGRCDERDTFFLHSFLLPSFPSSFLSFFLPCWWRAARLVIQSDIAVWHRWISETPSIHHTSHITVNGDSPDKKKEKLRTKKNNQQEEGW